MRIINIQIDDGSCLGSVCLDINVKYLGDEKLLTLLQQAYESYKRRSYDCSFVDYVVNLHPDFFRSVTPCEETTIYIKG